ncbi:AAA family ATPase [Myxococcota bacterium]|nr:AAA family ATPase [Myxococcota bacterium]
MQLAIPVLVSIDERDRHEVRLPGLSSKVFRGKSLSALLDDAALHLMEVIPKEPASAMPAYVLCPELELRKVKLQLELPEPGRKDTKTWKGRLSVILSRWPGDGFWTALVPKLSEERFALKTPGALEAVLGRFVAKIAEQRGTQVLDAAVVARREHLELLGVDTELPSILPSQPIRRKVKRTKKKTITERRAEAAKKAAEEKEKKRQLVPPTTLRQVATNLTHRALDGRLGRAHLRDAIVDAIVAEIERAGTSILLVGPSGAGKTAIVHEVVRRLAKDAKTLVDRRDVWQVDGNRIIAGMSVVGAWEARVGAMVTELTARQDVLFVDDLPALVYTGRSAHSSTNVAQYLEPHLSELRIIGECTHERLLATKDEAPGFFARFRIVHVDAMTEKDAMLVLVHQARALGAVEEVRVAPEALEAVLSLVRRFEARRAHPGKAVALLSRIAGDHGARSIDAFGRRVLDREAVVETFSRETGLPRSVLWEKDALELGALEEFFRTRIVAQPAAIEAAIDAVTVLQQGLVDPERPIATYLFVGPTGVGKTETAKALAELLFGSKDRLVRFDMSELVSAASVARLFGDRLHPDGELTRRIEQQPFSVVLLDEIEKAHPSVFDALLQVLGEGRLTNAAGRTVDFTSTIVIMTSNLGAREAGKSLGFGEPTAATLEAHYRSAAERWFRPELFNRIDRVVAFAPLGRDALTPLVRRLMEQMLTRRGLTRQSIVVDVDPALVEVLVAEGFDPRYGARSVKRILEAKLAVPLARHLVTSGAGSLAIAEVFPRGGDLELVVTRPEPRPVTATHRREEPTTWAAVERRHAELVRTIETLAESEVVDELRREHRDLVDRTGHLSTRPLSPEESDRLGFLAELLDDFQRRPSTDREPLSLALEDFANGHLDLDRYEERVENDDSWQEWDHEHTKTLYVEVPRPVNVDRGPLRAEVKRALAELELRTATLVYRIETAHVIPPRPLLLVLRPLTPWAEAFAMTTCLALARVWEGWGAGTRTFARDADGRWAVLPTEQTRLRHTALAVELAGPGLDALIAPDLGIWTSSIDVGPELLTSVVHVEEIGDGSAAIERLVAKDAERAARVEARRQRDLTSELTGAPLVYTFTSGRCTDAATGVELVATGALADGLRAILLRRVFAAVGPMMSGGAR